VADALTRHTSTRDAVQLVVHEGHKAFKRSLIALSPRQEQLGGLCRVGVNAPILRALASHAVSWPWFPPLDAKAGCCRSREGGVHGENGMAFHNTRRCDPHVDRRPASGAAARASDLK
jgi:hypothetical protein